MKNLNRIKLNNLIKTRINSSSITINKFINLISKTYISKNINNTSIISKHTTNNNFQYFLFNNFVNKQFSNNNTTLPRHYKLTLPNLSPSMEVGNYRRMEKKRRR